MKRVYTPFEKIVTVGFGVGFLAFGSLALACLCSPGAWRTPLAFLMVVCLAVSVWGVGSVCAHCRAEWGKD